MTLGTVRSTAVGRYVIINRDHRVYLLANIETWIVIEIEQEKEREVGLEGGDCNAIALFTHTQKAFRWLVRISYPHMQKCMYMHAYVYIHNRTVHGTYPECSCLASLNTAAVGYYTTLASLHPL